MKKAPDPTKPIRVTDKEKARADDGLTIVVRPQPSGTWLVALVDVGTGEVLPNSAMFAEDQTEIGKASADILRHWAKMGVGGMAEAARHRLWQKYKKQDEDRAEKAAPKEAALRSGLIRLARANPDLRAELLPLLTTMSSSPRQARDQSWVQDLKRPISSRPELIRALDGTDGVTHIRLSDFVPENFRPAVKSALKAIASGRVWSSEEVEAVEKASKAVAQNQKRILAESKGTDYEPDQKLVAARVRKILALVDALAQQARESWGSARQASHPLLTKVQKQKAPFLSAIKETIAGMAEYQEVLNEIKGDPEMPPKAVELAKRGLHTVEREILRWKAIGDDIHEIEAAVKDIVLSTHD
jgi:hypothetical protein